MSAEDLSDFSMLDLFRTETDNQAKILTEGLLALERDHQAADQMEILMRAAHSLKGAARIVDFNAAVRVAHVMEDCFVAAQKGSALLGPRQIDLLLKGVDLLIKISQTPEAEKAQWEGAQKGEIDSFVTSLTRFLEGLDRSEAKKADPRPSLLEKEVMTEHSSAALQKADRVLRVTAEHLNRLLGLAGESLVESHRLNPFADSLLKLKREHGDLIRMVDALRESLPAKEKNEQMQMQLLAIQNKAIECREFLGDRLGELALGLQQPLFECADALRGVLQPAAEDDHLFLERLHRLLEGGDLGLVLAETALVLGSHRNHLLSATLAPGSTAPDRVRYVSEGGVPGSWICHDRV